MKREIVWSYGGGVQTAAIAALVIQGKLPRPDLIVMAKTKYEISTTWDYLRSVIGPELNKIGLTVEIATQDLATAGLWSNDKILIPAFTTRDGKGKLPTYCSNEWKKRVIMRYLRQKGISYCETWIGISTNEIERMKPSGLQWYTHTYPLIELMPMSRANCLAEVEKMGWPAAPKSRCYICPNQSARAWQEMEDNLPGEFEKAIRFEREIQEKDPDLYLHGDCIPLATATRESRQQLEIFDGCDSGYCFV